MKKKRDSEYIEIRKGETVGYTNIKMDKNEKENERRKLMSIIIVIIYLKKIE